MTELIPLSEILDYKHELFDKYKQILNPPKSGIEEIRSDFDVFIMYDIKFMPVWLVMELIKLGFDVNLEEI